MIFRLAVMVSNFYIFEKYPFTREFVKFCLVGFTNLVIDLLIYSLLTRVLGVYYLLAAVLSFVVAVTWSFFINRRWTFKKSTGVIPGQYAKFFISNTISLAISLVLLYVLVDIWSINDLYAKGGVAVLVAFFNFTLNKLWTFGHIRSI
jgi:putative flippase GtrA